MREQSAEMHGKPHRSGSYTNWCITYRGHLWSGITGLAGDLAGQEPGVGTPTFLSPSLFCQGSLLPKPNCKLEGTMACGYSLHW